jgi:hypothetical protein
MVENRFKWRKFISISLFISFLWMGISGLVLYIAPPGRVFRWIGWDFLWLDVSAWQNIHTIFSIFFLAFGIVHLFSMNWKVFLSYWKAKIASNASNSREMIWALAISAMVTFCAISNIIPTKWIVDLKSYLSGSWTKEFGYPPVAYSQDLTLKDMAEFLLKISPEEFIQRIQDAGYRVEGIHQTLADIAKVNRTTPYEIFSKSTTGLNVLVIPGQKK